MSKLAWTKARLRRAISVSIGSGGGFGGSGAATVAGGVCTSHPLEDRWKLPLSPSGMCARCVTEVGDDDAEVPSLLSCGSDERGTVVVVPLDPLSSVGMLL